MAKINETTLHKSIKTLLTWRKTIYKNQWKIDKKFIEYIQWTNENNQKVNKDCQKFKITYSITQWKLSKSE